MSLNIKTDSGKIKVADVGGSSGGSASSNFSTEEQVVGKWINNKPLYQKTYEININSNNFSFNIDVDFEYINYDIVTNNVNYAMKDNFNNAGDRLFCYIYIPSKVFNIQTPNYYFGKCYVTIQYTKTSD